MTRGINDVDDMTYTASSISITHT